MVLFNLDQIRMRCLHPDLKGLLPSSPSSPTHRQWDECKGGREGICIFIIVGAASPGAYQPLTDLGKCSSDEGAQGTPHSCAALAPVLAEMHRSI